MAGELLSVEQVAERLGLHVRTVRNYVRDGRLKAVRIGKQYRIAREDLEELTGKPAVSGTRRVEVSSIVQVDAVDAATAQRLTTLLMSAANSARDDDGTPLRVDTVYHEERGSMKVVVLGSVAATTEVLRLIEAITD
ncbi:helix-turn-helix domain-containing protein [Amycolatopsis sp. 195334CR]|uniref:helix-turn-helix domain-containing protein n=1 Tax=Amycolatopsis sp. 195334CR TaxID=2814588 RepID=UPI001A8CA9F4|nr:helix-turn-helix domain-containing protein [Amycolatopsis sp. 195334CR]MBN6037988.1 helix-turn-helix domain-containing protein [Amycolatopsis sp. 195334CR]